MNTDQLIRAMAADASRQWPIGAVVSLTLLAIGSLAIIVLIRVLGANPDFIASMTPELFLLRQVSPLLLAIGSAAAALRLSRPDASAGSWYLVLAVALGLVGSLVGLELATQPASEWRSAAMGRTSAACLVSIGLMSVPLLGGITWALARGASTRPRLSGALAGLLAGSVAAAIYAIHCTEYSPLFYVVWYGLGIVGATAVGSVIGARWLRW